MTTQDVRPVRDLVLDGVLHSAPVMVYAYGQDGVCTFSEGRGLDAVGLRPGEMVGVRLWDYYADQPELVERMKRPLHGETFLATDALGDRVFDTWYLPLGEGPHGVLQALGISVDVTDRVRAEEGLDLYRAFVEAAPQFIALARPDGSVISVNPGGRRLAGIPDDVDVTRTTIADYLTPEGLARSIEVEQPAVVRDGHFEGETTLRHWPTGEGIPVQVASFLVTDRTTGTPAALATVQSDLREVVAAREAVQRQVAHQRGLLVHLHEAQEAERQRIAGEIHDDTVQVIAAVNLRLQSLRRALGPVLPPERVADLDALDRTVRAAAGRLRRLLVELDPPPAVGEDIAARLADTVETVMGDAAPVDLRVRVGAEPAPVVSRALLRSAQEALSNVRKHAQADLVHVELHEEAGEYVLRVLDDGRGPGTGGYDSGPLHRGVRSIRERAESLGGTAVITRRAGGGTAVEVRLPELPGDPGDAEPGAPSRFFLEQVMEDIGDAYCVLDSRWRCVYLNRAGYTLFERDPDDPVIGKVVWDELDIAPEIERACRQARDEQVPVEVTGYHAPRDRWIYHRILPTAGGLSIFARDVSAQRRESRLVGLGRDVVEAVAGPAPPDEAMRTALTALVTGWPLTAMRVRSADGVLSVTVGAPGAGAARRVPLAVSGRAVGAAEIWGEREPVDDGLLQLFALRLAAHLSGERDVGPDVEPRDATVRSMDHG